MKTSHLFTQLGLLGALAVVPAAALASSHREAPGIAEDQYADNTDVYAFISPTDANKLVVVANYVPLLLPQSGPNFYRFSDSALYTIFFDNNGDARPDIEYQFDFRSSVSNGGTFLYNTGDVTSLTDPDLNVKQHYTVTRVNLATGQRTELFSDAQVAPWFVGKRSFPAVSPGTSADAYDAVANSAIKVNGQSKFFAGPRDEPFFVDLHVFDLLGVAGAHTTDGVNVMSIVMEVPIDGLSQGGTRPTVATAQNAVLGIYANARRRASTILRQHRGPEHQGQWMQVSRLGWPLVNEVMIPLQDKDNYNRTHPVNDVANYGTYILNPEVTGLLNLVLGVGCPAIPMGAATDIVGLLSPNGTTAADLLRINVATGKTFADVAFPNGRKLTDDVTDTLLTVACNKPSTPVGDGVDANDKPFLTAFPYLAAPHSGNP